MECYNKYCHWNYKGMCCPESEEQIAKATPHMLDCPSSLRKDFEDELWKLHDACVGMLGRRNFKELQEVYKLLSSQRERVKHDK